MEGRGNGSMRGDWQGEEGKWIRWVAKEGRGKGR